MDRLTPEQRQKNMQSIRSSGSIIEKKLAKELWALGLRYRKNDSTVYGKPDLTFKRLRLAIFIDSEFWHGKNWSQRKKNEFKTNRDFWIKKIEGNIMRDIQVNRELKLIGWTVLRFWGNDVLKKNDKCIKKIINTINELEFQNMARAI
jgi:DNA mismatch endonuclease Vsr